MMDGVQRAAAGGGTQDANMSTRLPDRGGALLERANGQALSKQDVDPRPPR